MLGINRHLRNTIILCWLGWVLDFYDLILIVFLIPQIEVSLNINSNISVWLIGIGLGGSGIGGILFGMLSDLYGRKKILLLTVLLFSSGILMTAFTQTTTQFLIARFITGLGLGGEWATGHSIIAESVPAKTRARWGALLQSGEPVGVMMAAIMGFLIAPYIGWRYVFIISSFFGLVILIFRSHLQESSVWQKSKRLTYVSWGKQFRPFFHAYKFLIFLTFILAVFKLGTYWTCYTWLPRFINESYGQAIGKSALWIICGQIGQFIGMYVFGFVADWIGRRWGFTLFSLLTAMVLFCLAVFWDLLFQEQQILFWLLIFFLGLGSGCTPGFGTLLAEIFPTAQRTFAMGTIYNLARGMQIFSPVIVGLAVERWGLLGGLMIPCLLALLTAMWVWTLPERKGKPLQDSYLIED